MIYNGKKTLQDNPHPKELMLHNLVRPTSSLQCLPTRSVVVELLLLVWLVDDVEVVVTELVVVEVVAVELDVVKVVVLLLLAVDVEL